MTNTTSNVYSKIAYDNKPWTPEEERDVINRLWNNKDKDKFVNEALKHNLGLVFALVKRYSKLQSEDVIQRAVIALSNALYSYDPSKNTKISTWVTNPIRWAILQAINPCTSDSSDYERVLEFNRRNNTSYSIVSIDDKIGHDDDTAETIGNTISVDSLNKNYIIRLGLETSSEKLRTNEISIELKKIMTSFPKFLTKKEVLVINGIVSGLNLSEIGIKLKLSRVRISQLSKSAFSKIRNSKYGNQLKSLLH